MRVLVVEDDARIRRFVVQGLEEEGATTKTAETGQDFATLASDGSFDAVVLDLGLPDADGIDVLETLRRDGCRTPVLVLTARDSIEDRVRGLDAGADDYLVKPFAFVELSARLRALHRRNREHDDRDQLHVGDLVLDIRKRRVTRADKRIDLSPREFSLLEYLMRHAGEVVTRAMIAENVWDQSVEHFSNVIDVYMGYLRKKVDRPFDGPRLVCTVRGVGYTVPDTEPA